MRQLALIMRSAWSKVRIVDTYAKAGMVTAMATVLTMPPSIKRADIGIGISITGTDVTKRVLQIWSLADDKPPSLVPAKRATDLRQHS